MSLSPCTCCGYLLPLQSHDQLCPECGAGLARRVRIGARRDIYTVALLFYIIFSAPTILALLTTISGWLVAHFVLRIPNPHWVQHGEYLSLDILGAINGLLFLLSLVTLPFAALVVPLVIIGEYRLVRALHRTGRGTCRFAVLIAVPFVAAAAVWWPIPGLTTEPLIRVLSNWLPD